MREELKLSQTYWDDMWRFDVDAAIIDPADSSGRKNAYIRTQPELTGSGYHCFFRQR